MKDTRREFIQKALAVAISSQFAMHAVAQGRSSSKSTDSEGAAADPLEGASAQTFEPWIGSSFRASLKNAFVGTLTLVAVDGAKDEEALGVPSARGAAITTFALRFRKVGAPLAQATYTLEHDWLGTFSLLLVPSGLRGSTSTSSAVFTLLKVR